MTRLHPALLTAAFCLLTATGCGDEEIAAQEQILIVDTRVIDFRSVELNTVSRLTIEFSNDTSELTGGKTVTITDIAPGEGWTDEFQWNGPMPPQDLGPEDTLRLELLYQPRDAGPDESELLITSTDPVVPVFTLLLLGVGF